MYGILQLGWKHLESRMVSWRNQLHVQLLASMNGKWWLPWQLNVYCMMYWPNDRCFLLSLSLIIISISPFGIHNILNGTSHRTSSFAKELTVHNLTKETNGGVKQSGVNGEKGRICSWITQIFNKIRSRVLKAYHTKCILRWGLKLWHCMLVGEKISMHGEQPGWKSVVPYGTSRTVVGRGWWRGFKDNGWGQNRKWWKRGKWEQGHGSLWRLK